MSSTTRKSSLNDTCLARSSALLAKIPIPGLQEKTHVFRHELLKSPKFGTAETEVASESHRYKPELCREVVAVNVDVRWLIGFVAIEVKTIWSEPEHGRHRGDS